MIRNIILEVLHYTGRYVSEYEDEFVAKVKGSYKVKQESEVKVLKKRISREQK